MQRGCHRVSRRVMGWRKGCHGGGEGVESGCHWFIGGVIGLGGGCRRESRADACHCTSRGKCRGLQRARHVTPSGSQWIARPHCLLLAGTGRTDRVSTISCKTIDAEILLARVTLNAEQMELTPACQRTRGYVQRFKLKRTYMQLDLQSVRSPTDAHGLEPHSNSALQTECTQRIPEQTLLMS